MRATLKCSMRDAMRASSRNICWKRRSDRVLREDGLQRDELLEPVLATLAGDPDAGHPSLGQRAEQLVAIEPVPWGEGRAGVLGDGARHLLRIHQPNSEGVTMQPWLNRG